MYMDCYKESRRGDSCITIMQKTYIPTVFAMEALACLQAIRSGLDLGLQEFEAKLVEEDREGLRSRGRSKEILDCALFTCLCEEFPFPILSVGMCLGGLLGLPLSNYGLIPVYHDVVASFSHGLTHFRHDVIASFSYGLTHFRCIASDRSHGLAMIFTIHSSHFFHPFL
ncbi:hypothetical protein Gotur_025234 [Gossypium turneri]